MAGLGQLLCGTLFFLHMDSALEKQRKEGNFRGQAKIKLRGRLQPPTAGIVSKPLI